MLRQGLTNYCHWLWKRQSRLFDLVRILKGRSRVASAFCIMGTKFLLRISEGHSLRSNTPDGAFKVGMAPQHCAVNCAPDKS
jgi:hypothetical protein